MTDNGHEVLTEELLERLLASASPEAYLASAPTEARDLAAYLHDLINARGIGRADVIRASGVNATFCYQVFQGTRRPGRDTALMLAFGIGCSLRETQRLLRLAGDAELWVRNRRDAIIIHCLSAGLSREECDDALYRLGEATLFAAGE